MCCFVLRVQENWARRVAPYTRRESERINKFDEGDPLHEGILYPDLMSIAYSR